MSRAVKTNATWLVTSIGVTALIHVFFVISVVVLSDNVNIFDCQDYPIFCVEDDSFANAQTIEAALAFKAVDPKSKQPVKEKKKKFRPKDEGVSRDPDAKPRDKKDDPDHKVAVEDHEIDFESTLRKNRQEDPDKSSTGVDQKPIEGSATGSEWGTEREAKGNPYAGELKGRIHSVWEVPSLETEGGSALGCVRLNRDGKIIDSKLKKPSKNSNLNRSVRLALKKAPPMEKPVPADMIDLLTVKGICFRFELEEQ